MSDEKIHEIAEEAVNKWLSERKTEETVTNRDMLAVLTGVTIGSLVCYLIENSKVKKRLKKIENRLEIED